ncbi:MAG: guanylate kinase [Nitriliruptoraceae bacterium]
MTDRGLVVVLSGPSGVGKGSVHARLRETVPDSRLSVSVTTRPARAGEVDHVDYHFVDEAEFDRLVAAGQLLEHATYSGNRYGTPRAQVEGSVEQGQVVLLDIEVQGALQVRASMPDALLVFLVPPSMEELERRLRARGTEDDAEIARRLGHARDELVAADEFDVQVVNRDIDECVASLTERIAAMRGA